MVVLLAIAVIGLAGCTTTQKGAGIGTVLGAGAGAAIGSASGHAGEGALIGAGVGAAGGALIGEQMATKFCPTCGADYPGDVGYCPKCGCELQYKK